MTFFRLSPFSTLVVQQPLSSTTIATGGASMRQPPPVTHQRQVERNERRIHPRQKIDSSRQLLASTVPSLYLCYYYYFLPNYVVFDISPCCCVCSTTGHEGLCDWSSFWRRDFGRDAAKAWISLDTSFGRRPLGYGLAISFQLVPTLPRTSPLAEILPNTKHLNCADPTRYVRGKLWLLLIG
jgi:hypothetical protein